MLFAIWGPPVSNFLPPLLPYTYLVHLKCPLKICTYCPTWYVRVRILNVEFCRSNFIATGWYVSKFHEDSLLVVTLVLTNCKVVEIIEV